MFRLATKRPALNACTMRFYATVDPKSINVRQPNVKLWESAKVQHPTEDVFANNKTVVVFGLPGAFTPTCSSTHAPSFIQNAEKFKKHNAEVICVSVNDPFVMDAWGKQLGAEGQVKMLADPEASFTKAIKMDVDLSAAGLGTRSKRYSMLVKNGQVVYVNVEDSPGACTVSDAATILKQIEKKD